MASRTSAAAPLFRRPFGRARAHATRAPRTLARFPTAAGFLVSVSVMSTKSLRSVPTHQGQACYLRMLSLLPVSPVCSYLTPLRTAAHAPVEYHDVRHLESAIPATPTSFKQAARPSRTHPFDFDLLLSAGPIRRRRSHSRKQRAVTSALFLTTIEHAQGCRAGTKDRRGRGCVMSRSTSVLWSPGAFGIYFNTQFGLREGLNQSDACLLLGCQWRATAGSQKSQLPSYQYQTRKRLASSVVRVSQQQRTFLDRALT